MQSGNSNTNIKVLFQILYGNKTLLDNQNMSVGISITNMLYKKTQRCYENH